MRAEAGQQHTKAPLPDGGGDHSDATWSGKRLRFSRKQLVFHPTKAQAVAHREKEVPFHAFTLVTRADRTTIGKRRRAAVRLGDPKR